MKNDKTQTGNNVDSNIYIYIYIFWLEFNIYIFFNCKPMAKLS